jgi:hypothetical protein
MTTTPRQRRKQPACAVRIARPGGEGFGGNCGRPATRLVGTTPMCDRHAEAVEQGCRPLLVGEDRPRARTALSSVESSVALLPEAARAEARPGRARDDYAPRVEVDAEWLAGLWSQLDAAESGPAVA